MSSDVTPPTDVAALACIMVVALLTGFTCAWAVWNGGGWAMVALVAGMVAIAPCAYGWGRAAERAAAHRRGRRP